MRSGARPSSGAATELIHGTFFQVHKLRRGWVWGQADCQLPGAVLPGYVGWVKLKSLSSNVSKPSHKVTAMSAPVFAKANIKARVKLCLPMGSTFAGKKSGDFIETEHGFLDAKHVSTLTKASLYPDWIAIAESLLGQPYIWGGVSSYGLDCSGLVQTALRNFGQDAPRDSDQQSLLGSAVPITQDFSGLKRGDLIFWKGHVGIMTSPSRLLHANAHHMLVASEPLVTAAARIQKNAGSVTSIRRL